jgi:hypothetical protein
MSNLKSFRRGWLCLAILGSALRASPALAEPEFPGAIFDAADMKCVPTCTLCHTTNPGTATTWQAKMLGPTLVGAGLKAGDPDTMNAAFKTYAATHATEVAKIKQGIDPQTGANVCGPTYGCGAHIVRRSPSNDNGGPLFIVGAMVVGGLLRRRRSR